MQRIVVLVLILLSQKVALSQTPTVGLVYYDSMVSDGYTLLTSFHSTDTYLIDNCGFVVHSWPSEYYPGHEVKLLEDGKLLRTGRIDSPYFLSGGAGGRIEILNWDGSVESLLPSEE